MARYNGFSREKMFEEFERILTTTKLTDFSQRQLTQRVRVGDVEIGGGAPIVIQSMTNTVTSDVDATVEQTMQLNKAGSQLVRVTVMNQAYAKAVPEIKKRLTDAGYNVPIIGDFHFIGHKLLQDVPECAAALDKYRINPGNNGSDDEFKTFIKIAVDNGKPIRTGVNKGSLTSSPRAIGTLVLNELMSQNAKLPKPYSAEDIIVLSMVETALRAADMSLGYGLPKDKLIIAVKVSKIREMVLSYRLLSALSDFTLHLGLTEAGARNKGAIYSTVALTQLLARGIGDTIRTSLTPSPNESRTAEVAICRNIARTLADRAKNAKNKNDFGSYLKLHNEKTARSPQELEYADAVRYAVQGAFEPESIVSASSIDPKLRDIVMEAT
ncbi:MAG: flavodoxin-dependent (E)-4-hydroxy-3-methylbut-2-enyl-diphosphate synthase, partial [Patescibacteria group bacterium]